MRRSAKGPNTFSQTIKDLQPGRLYPDPDTGFENRSNVPIGITDGRKTHMTRKRIVMSDDISERMRFPGRITCFVIAMLVLTSSELFGAPAEPTVIDSFHAPQPFVASRIAAAWVLFGSAALSLVAVVLAFVLSAIPAVHHLSRWAMLAAKVFVILTMIALVIGLTLTAVVILKETRMFAQRPVRPAALH